MTLNHVLNDLLENLSQALKQGKDRVIYSFADVEQWQADVLATLLDYQLVKPISAMQSIECTGCENNCFMDVVSHQINDKTRYFIVCEDSEQQAQMGIIKIPVEHLKQWQFSIKNIALFIAKKLGFEDVKFNESGKLNIISLGMLTNTKGRQWVHLHKQPLALDVNQGKIPLSELLFVDKGKLTIDRVRIDYLLAINKPLKPSKAYQSNTDKNDQKKANTQAMYQNWQDEHERLKITKPNQFKKWYAFQISKLPIAQGKTVDTIERKLKS